MLHLDCTGVTRYRTLHCRSKLWVQLPVSLLWTLGKLFTPLVTKHYNQLLSKAQVGLVILLASDHKVIVHWIRLVLTEMGERLQVLMSLFD